MKNYFRITISPIKNFCRKVMKRLFAILCLVNSIEAMPSFGQTISFDKSLEQLTDALASKLLTHQNLKMAVWDLTNLDGSISPIGKYIAEDMSINLSDKFYLVNRNQLNTLLKENKLRSEGFIDQVTMKQLKKLAQVDIIISGTVSILSNNIKITIQAMDSVAHIVGATKGDVPMNDDIKELLGINTGTGNQGFNRSLSSDEQINNPETVNKDCQKNNVGDYCFTNTTGYIVELSLDPDNDNVPYNEKRMTLNSGQSQCFYNLASGSWKYGAIVHSGSNDIQKTGFVYIETCKSKSLSIK